MTFPFPRAENAYIDTNGPVTYVRIQLFVSGGYEMNQLTTINAVLRILIAEEENKETMLVNGGRYAYHYLLNTIPAVAWAVARCRTKSLCDGWLLPNVIAINLQAKFSLLNKIAQSLRSLWLTPAGNSISYKRPFRLHSGKHTISIELSLFDISAKSFVCIPCRQAVSKSTNFDRRLNVSWNRYPRLLRIWLGDVWLRWLLHPVIYSVYWHHI